MKKSEAIKVAIESNVVEAVKGIFIHPGVRYTYEDGCGEHESQTAKLVLGTTECDAQLVKKLAKAREIAMSKLKIVGADVLVIDCGYKEKNWRCFHELERRSGDGRILGMSVKKTKTAGVLPLGAIFMISDRPEVSQEAEEAAGYKKVGAGAFEFSGKGTAAGAAGAEAGVIVATDSGVTVSEGGKEVVADFLASLKEHLSSGSSTVSSLTDAFWGLTDYSGRYSYSTKIGGDRDGDGRKDGKKVSLVITDDIPF